MRVFQKGYWAVVLAVGLMACEAPGPETTPPLGPRVQGLNSDLALGATGDQVKVVQDYLTRFGYFPNSSLQQEFPAWRPVVSDSPTLGVFDQNTSDAILALQHNAGLPLTGIVDAGTRAALQRHRCGVPDGIPRADLQDKYAPLGPKWSSSTVTWYVKNFDDVTQAQADAAVSAALGTWAAQTSLPAFSKASWFTAANIQIQFGAIDGPGTILASTSFSGTSASMLIDTAETWSVATPTPSGSTDLQTVVLHELGHAIGSGTRR